MGGSSPRRRSQLSSSRPAQPTRIALRQARAPVTSVCVACGSRQLVRALPTSATPLTAAISTMSTLVQCRACAVISPDFNHSRAPLDTSPPTVDAHALIDDLLAAVADADTQRKLSHRLDAAQGDVARLCQGYVPFALAVLSAAASAHGFARGIDGFRATIRALQRHTREDDALVAKLVQLRRVLTPTGHWVQSDADADVSDAQAEVQAAVAARAHADQLARQQADAAHAESLAARMLRLRAFKRAHELDPTLEHPPVLLTWPPRALATHAQARVQLRVTARLAMSYRWFRNGRALAELPMLQEVSVHGPTLVLSPLTRRVTGDYHCVCANDEGAVASPVTRVQLVALHARRIANRRLRALPTAQGEPLVALARSQPPPTLSSASSQPVSLPPLIATCVAGSLLLLRLSGQSLTPVSVLVAPSSAPSATAIAWLATRGQLVVASGHCWGLWQLDEATAPAAVATGATPGSSSRCRLRSIEAHTLAASSSMAAIASVHLALQDCLLLLSDMDHSLVSFTLAPEVHHCRTLRLDGEARIAHIATIPAAVDGDPAADWVAVCFRGQRHVDIHDAHALAQSASSPSPSVHHRLTTPLPVHRTAFHARGSALAVAEAGGLKSWLAVYHPGRAATASRVRFVAHVGKLTALQWTLRSSLLLSGGTDGYVKLWDLEQSMACVFRMHVDERGIQSALLLSAPNAPSVMNGGQREGQDKGVDAGVDADADADAHADTARSFLFAMGISKYRLHALQLTQLGAFEQSRVLVTHHAATQIQKTWKGRYTRMLVTQHLSLMR